LRTIRIGAGAGYSGDRIEPAVELAEHGQLDYLVFECLAERTIALAQQAKRRDPLGGFDPLLEARMRAVLPAAVRQRVRIITNMGAANAVGAARRTAEIAAELGLGGMRIAAVCGDDVLAQVLEGDYRFEESGTRVQDLGAAIISANAYLGVEPLLEALRTGAGVVITGRAADPALFMAPLFHEFGWSTTGWHKLGQSTVVGHLLECAGQVTGGYFADPGYKNVPDLARLGFPIGEVDAEGNVVICKVAGTGGQVSVATCKEQLLYEIHDPEHYYQPDVVADFSQVRIEAVGPDRVRVTGGRGKPCTGLLKVSVGYIDGYVGEGQISYAGPGALARAQLACEIVRERFRIAGIGGDEARFDLIGVDALHGARLSSRSVEPYEVRVRVAARADSMREAERIGNEVETLYTNGPAGGGGVFKHAKEIVAVQSVLVPSTLVKASVQTVEA
jgi:hypothetical protein